MSPRSRGRPPGRGRRQQPRRPAARQSGPHRGEAPAGDNTPGYGEEMTDCWFDEPEPGDRRSWALPAAHGTCQGLDLELLDPGEEDERALQRVEDEGMGGGEHAHLHRVKQALARVQSLGRAS